MSDKIAEKNTTIVRAISANGGIVVAAIDATDIVSEMERVHKTSAVVSAALGRLLTAAALMGSFMKSENDSLTLQVNGGGPVGRLVAVADGDGTVRGYAANPVVELPLRADGKLDVGGAVGSDGVVSVVRDLGLREPYIGQTPLVSGEIAEDITAYYAASEQTPTVCALGVLVNPDLSIRRAGGYLLQLLPGASEDEIAQVESNINNIPPITDFLESDGTAEQLAELALQGFEPEILDAGFSLYRCHCSSARTEAILKSLGKEELQQMLAEDPMAHAECHFCGADYAFDIAQLLGEPQG